MEEVHPIEGAAYAWVRDNAQRLIATFMRDVAVVPDGRSTTIFMAGSPGAGKTEVAERLIEVFERRPLHIDPDAIRQLCPGYTGNNADRFQRAVGKGVHILFDHALTIEANCIPDGTFAYHGALHNVARAPARQRYCAIYFVYQDPVAAWRWVQERERRMGRRITKEAFIETFVGAIHNANAAKKIYGASVDLHFLFKEYDNTYERLERNVTSIDPYLDERYSTESLNKLLS